jgi:ATP-dependent Lhr-like helicase
VTRLREVRRAPPGEPLAVSAADPLNVAGILTPDERVARTARRRVVIGGPATSPSLAPTPP